MLEARAARMRTARAGRPRISASIPRGWSSRLRHDLLAGVAALLSVAKPAGRAGLRPGTERQLRAVEEELLGLVSHELRTPVTTIYGNAQLLAARSAGFAPGERLMIRDIADDSQRLLGILDNVLLLARLEAGMAPYREPLLLTHHLRAACAQASELRGRDVSFVVHGGDDVVVEADHVCLELLMRNLLANAVAYSPKVAAVEVVLDATPGEALVSVLDRGIGLSAEPLDQLAQPFYRGAGAQRIVGGMGLGLTVCERILEAHGGRLWARPRPDGGANVGFALPLMADPGA